MGVNQTATYLHRQDLQEAIKAAPPLMLFIADELFPDREVEKNSGQVPVLDMANYADDVPEEKIRKAEGAPAKQVNMSVSEQTFSCVDRSLEFHYPWNKKTNADDQLDLETEAVIRLAMTHSIRRERRVVTLLTDTVTNWQNGAGMITTSNDWYGTSAAVKLDSSNALTRLLNRGGNPMTAKAWMSYNTFKLLLRQEGLITDVRNTEVPNMLLTPQNKGRVAAQLGVQDLIVGGVVYNTKAEGVTPDLSQVWPDNFVGFGNYSLGGAGNYVVGRTYVNTKYKGKLFVDSREDADVEADITRVGNNLQEKVNFANLQVLLKITP